MNILPKKSWHVRNYKNIERVKRDEAKAAEEDKNKQERAALANQEARTSLLRSKAHQLTPQARDGNQHFEIVQQSQDSEPKHVDFFSELGTEKGKTNKEREKEDKDARESYEKKIGLLNYLGQSSAEAQTTKPWYFKPHRKSDEDEPRIQDAKRKANLDPMVEMDKHLGTKRPKPEPSKPFKPELPKPSQPELPKLCAIRPAASTHGPSSRRANTRQSVNEKKPHRRKHKKHDKHKSKKDKKTKKKHSHDVEDAAIVKSVRAGPSIEQLREARFKREAVERARTNRLLSGRPADDKTTSDEVTDQPGRYNSQFHPELVRRKRNPSHYGLT